MNKKSVQEGQPDPETSENGRILVVDDEESICDVLDLILTEEGYTVDTACGKSSALEQFDSHHYDVVLQDIKLAGTSGIDLLKEYKDRDEECRVIMITAYSTWDSTVKAMRLGAFDYFKKPFDNDEIKSGIRSAIESRRVDQEQERDELPIFKHLIGDSDSLTEIRKTIHKVASSNVTVLVCGESGSGKELVSRAIHHMSPRKHHTFMSINCGAFPESLLESELFGHKKGAFTGAHEEKKGVLEVADNGTVLLDEIAEMPMEMQVKFLRVLENSEFKPVGEVEKKHVDLRFIAATNKDIEEMVERGEFREDLFYRLNVINITLPPLRDRGEDILLLAGHFLSQYADHADGEIEGFTEAAKDRMMSYHWPGNVRELKNAVRRAVALCEGGEIDPDLLFQDDQENQEERPSSHSETTLPEQGGIDLEEELKQIEIEYIQSALEKTNHSITEAAEYLGVSFRSLRYKIDKYDISATS